MRRIAWLALLVWLAFLLVLGWHTCALAQAALSVSLRWDPVIHPQLAGYQVQRCALTSGQSACTPVDLPGATTGSTVTTYTDTTPLSGTSYRYGVVALCPPCTPTRSDVSNLVTLTVGAPPGAPPSLAATVFLPQAGMVATADSQETAWAANAARAAIDGSLATFWHTQWGTARPGYPHWLMLTLPKQGLWWVGGLRYTPRQDGNVNGTILDYRIEVSPDGVTWQVVTSGTWASTTQPKEVRFPPVLVRALRLVGLSALGDGPYASCAELVLMQGVVP